MPNDKKLATRKGFWDSSKRHFNDAKLLEDHNRFQNAEQLIGYSAECAVKYIIFVLLEKEESSVKSVEFPKIDGGNLPTINLLQHFPELTNTIGAHKQDFEILAKGRQNPHFYNGLKVQLDNFKKWNISHRYQENRAGFCEDYSQWKNSTKELFDLCDSLKLDGISQ